MVVQNGKLTITENTTLHRLNSHTWEGKKGINTSANMWLVTEIWVGGAHHRRKDLGIFDVIFLVSCFQKKKNQIHGCVRPFLHYYKYLRLGNLFFSYCVIVAYSFSLWYSMPLCEYTSLLVLLLMDIRVKFQFGAIVNGAVVTISVPVF